MNEKLVPLNTADSARTSLICRRTSGPALPPPVSRPSLHAIHRRRAKPPARMRSLTHPGGSELKPGRHFPRGRLSIADCCAGVWRHGWKQCRVGVRHPLSMHKEHDRIVMARRGWSLRWKQAGDEPVFASWDVIGLSLSQIEKASAHSSRSSLSPLTDISSFTAGFVGDFDQAAAPCNTFRL